MNVSVIIFISQISITVSAIQTQSDSIVPLVTSDECFVYIRSIDFPTQYWYAFHETLPILSEISKTLWTVETGFFANNSKAVSFKVCIFCFCILLNG